MIPKINSEFRASAGHAGWICKVLVKTPNNATHETTKTGKKKKFLAFVQTLRLVIDHIFVWKIFYLEKFTSCTQETPQAGVCPYLACWNPIVFLVFRTTQHYRDIKVTTQTRASDRTTQQQRMVQTGDDSFEPQPQPLQATCSGCNSQSHTKFR